MRRRMAGAFRSGRIASTFKLTQLMGSIGARQRKSVAQVALRYLIEQGAVPIPGAKNESQARDNAGALTFSLSTSELAELREATDALTGNPAAGQSLASAA